MCVCVCVCVFARVRAYLMCVDSTSSTVPLLLQLLQMCRGVCERVDACTLNLPNPQSEDHFKPIHKQGHNASVPTCLPNCTHDHLT